MHRYIKDPVIAPARAKKKKAASWDRSASIYDAKSGQVYTEVNYVPPSTDDLHWQYQSPGHARKGYRLNKGPPSLETIAIRFVLRNLSNFVTDSLQGVPWSIGSKIWAQVMQRDLVSFHAWRIFASAYPNEGDQSISWYSATIENPVLSLDSYMKSIRSDSFQWVTALSISITNITHNDLAALSSMPNLCALDMQGVRPNMKSSVDDRMIRSWSLAAEEINAFPRLTVLTLRHQSEVTTRCFEYLHRFPSLILFNLSNTKIKASDAAFADSHGWSYTTAREAPTIMSTLKENATASLSDLQAMLYRECVRITHQPPLPASADADTATKASMTPLLSFHIGQPSPASTTSRALLVFRRARYQAAPAPAPASEPTASSAAASPTAPMATRTDREEDRSLPVLVRGRHVDEGDAEAEAKTNVEDEAETKRTKNKKRKLKDSRRQDFGDLLSQFSG